MRSFFGISILVFGILSCSRQSEQKDFNRIGNWPLKIDSLSLGINVIHSPSIVYAQENTKDPEKRGKYQLKHITSITSLEQGLEIVEFGGYKWENNKWMLSTLNGKPYGRDKFIKWYKCEKGQLKKGVEYSDSDNWIGTSESLDGKVINGLWYFIVKNKQGQYFYGAAELKGFLKQK